MPGEEDEPAVSVRNPVVLVLHCPWCNKAEGSTVTIGISSYRWRIHKCLLVRKSAYFDRVLEEAEHLLPSGFPGGVAALDAVVSFCFDAGVAVMRPSNVAALRCAAEFLGMDERQSVGNLAHRTDTYLTHVVFRSWEDTLIVLAECQALLPLAEELNIVWRCVEALSSMVAASSSSSSDSSSSQEELGWWWIEDLVTMPAAFFARIVRALRKKGIGERSIGELIVKFSDRWLFSSSCDHENNNNQRFLLTNSSSDDQAEHPQLERTFSTESSKDELELGLSPASSTNCSSSDRDASSEHQTCSNLHLQLGFHDDGTRTTQVGGFHTAVEKLALLEAIAELLPYEKTAVPISFLFLLLRYAFAMDASSECKSQIETRISLQLENATLDDFLMPFKSPSKENCKLNFELDSIKQIVARFLSQQHRSIVSAKNEFRSASLAAATNMHVANAAIISQQQQQQQQAVCAVVKVWDEYLGEIACDANIPPEKFTDLVEVVPAYARVNHDQLYKVIQIFLKAHAEISPQERAAVCRALNCLKLSQEVCIQAVQNELMPLRMIVQAMFVQQLQTRNAISTHLRAVTSSPMQMQQQLEKLATQMKMNHAFEGGARKNSNVMEDLQETNMRLQSLEATMARMKKSLRESSKTRLSDFDFSCNDDHQKKGDENGSCISSSSSSSHTAHNDGNNNNINIGNNKEKRRFFLKKSCSSRSNRSNRGVARISRLFHKMGILSFCRAANKNFPDSSFKELPCTKKLPCRVKCRASTGCIPIESEDFAGDDDKTVSSSRDGKTSWDDVDGCDRCAADANRIVQQHLRHHSIA